MVRTIFFSFLLVLFNSNLIAQTYSWSGYTNGATTYTTGIMTSTITSTNPGFQNTTPRYYSGATVGSGQCGFAGGLALENMFGNVTTAHATLTISFTSGNTTNGTCASMQFQIKDINADESNQTFRDFVYISAIDGNNVAIPVASITATGGGNKTITTSGGTTRIIAGSTGTYGSRSQTACDNVTITVTPPAGTPLKSITIRYQPSYEAASGTSGYWNFTSPYRPAYQYISISSLTGTATSSCAVLPVEITKFKSNCENETKKLIWETATETNNKFFHIEGSEDGENFLSLGKVDGAGNSNHSTEYNWEIKDDSNSLKYFRLLQEDLDGKIRYSEIITSECKNELDIMVYPNPANQKINLLMNEDIEWEQIVIYDLIGNIVMNKKYSEDTEEKIEINLDELSPSYYTIGIIDRNNALIKAIPFIKE